MAYTVAGYGFDTGDLTKEDLYKFIKRLGDLESLAEDILEKPTIDSKEDLEAILDEVGDWVFVGDYYITEGLGKLTGRDVFLEFGTFVGVGTSPFRIKGGFRDEASFQNCIRKYFPGSELTFGYILTGNDWEDDNYFIE